MKLTHIYVYIVIDIHPIGFDSCVANVLPARIDGDNVYAMPMRIDSDYLSA